MQIPYETALRPNRGRTNHGGPRRSGRSKQKVKVNEVVRYRPPKPRSLNKTQLINPNGHMHMARVQGPVFFCAAYAAPASLLSSGSRLEALRGTAAGSGSGL